MATDDEIRVEYTYLKRHQGYWHRDTPPILESIIALTRSLRWHGTQNYPIRLPELRMPLRIPPPDDPPLPPEHMGLPPRRRERPPLDQRLQPPPDGLNAQPRPLTYLRPVMAAHERAIEFVRNRASEGITVQYKVAQRLGLTVAVHESREGNYESLMRTGGLLPPVTSP
jgi:hypothetical protein